jgi:hypothetical protein
MFLCICNLPRPCSLGTNDNTLNFGRGGSPGIRAIWRVVFRESGIHVAADFHTLAAPILYTYKNGEVVEVLQEGVAYFYTFFLKPFKGQENWGQCANLDSN